MAAKTGTDPGAEAGIRADGVRKVYRVGKKNERAALDGFDLDVPGGTVCGLLGPNGAGKTTAVRILATLLQVDGGRAEVAGIDVAAEPKRVRKVIGLVGQKAAVDEVLGARQNLVMIGRLHHLGRRAARRRADELLERFTLLDDADTAVKEFSGGMRRRLDLAASLVLRPKVLFLDEPTTGLDPRGRIEVWDAVRSFVAEGTTVLLTTQYLDEADQLADRIAVMEAGRVIVEGTSSQLKEKVGGDHLDVVVRDPAHLTQAASAMREITGVEPGVRAETRTVSVPISDRVAALASTLTRLEQDRIEVDDIVVRRPTLDDVFLAVTGRHAVDAVGTGRATEEVVSR